jgi:hypothetical protein
MELKILQPPLVRETEVPVRALVMMMLEVVQAGLLDMVIMIFY